jgi:hypothetical protein
MNNCKIALKLPENYNPLEDEVYMSPYMLRFFQNKLENMLNEILYKRDCQEALKIDPPFDQYKG